MIFQCGDLERALRTPELMPDARAHAERCEECGLQLSLWAEISRAAPQLHQEWESPDLWPRIRIALDSEPRRAARGGRPFQWALALAAMIVLGVVLSTPRNTVQSASRELLTGAALADVQQAEEAYAKSIANLSAVAGPQLERSSSPLAAAYREKLLMLDSAIAEMKSTAAQNPYNAYLRTELASLYGEKKKTLQGWMNDAKHN
jgi:hypothetical protein